MKKIITLAIVAAMLFVPQITKASEPYNFNSLEPVTEGVGIIGGINLPTVTSQGWKPTMKVTGRVGVAFKHEFDFGLAIQPQLVYNTKNVFLSQSMADTETFRANVKNGYVELPIQVQWGFRNVVAGRPFLFAEPFIGYGLHSYVETNYYGEKAQRSNKWDECNVARFEGGLGFGIGYEIWHLQLSAQFNFNFGHLAKNPGLEYSDNHQVSTIAHVFGNNNFKGFYFTIGFFL